MDYQVIKEGDLFFLTDKNGDVTGNNEVGHGLYTKDTRFLSRMEVFINGEKPELLSSTANKSYIASFHLMNVVKDKGAIEVVRERFIYDGVLYEKVKLTNYFTEKTNFDFSISFDADFQDMFLVRKYRTGNVGEITDRKQDDQSLTISYQGADQITRETKVTWDKQATSVEEHGKVNFDLTLDPKEQLQIVFNVVPIIDNQAGTILSYEEGLNKLEASYEKWSDETTRVTTDDQSFNGLYERGVQDLRMLMTDIGQGDIPVAGLPWFAVPFGRDSLITSLFMLPLNPNKVKGTLRTLAKYQGTKIDPWRDEQPGKIMHEIRFGELVTTNQSPFGPYYGTVDSTPLFLVLITEYYRWTGDLELVKELQPNIERALSWIDTKLEQEGTDFLTYHQEAEKGFPNQGWKDSSNSIVHKTGEFAKSPIALSEVQGYFYQAKKSLAPIFKAMGQAELADKLEQEADKLKQQFEEKFWLEEEGIYAIALDKNQEKVESVSSNPGHILMAELPSTKRAAKTVKRMVEPDMFNGYGIRTMSTESAGYYPMSYHNGSVWPHDNGMILLGLNRLGYKQEAELIISGLLESSKYFEYQRLPELFCGHDSDLGYPVSYPTTCSPQAWSAGTSIVFVQAMLGIDPNALRKEITIAPFLPANMNELLVENMHIGTGTIDIKVVRVDRDIKVDVISNTTGFTVIQK